MAMTKKKGEVEERHPSGVTRRAESMLPGADLGSYELVAELVSGELISIWAAVLHRSAEGSPVVVVRLRNVVNEHPTLRGAFVRDIRTFEAVRSGCVAHVLEARSVQERAFVALEPIEGVPLAELLLAASMRRESLTMPALMQLALQLTSALAVLHRTRVAAAPTGVVHGDLGPHSIWISPEGRVCLLPTGMGHVACHPAAPPSSPHLRYKAPEQIARPLLGKGLDPRVDIFAFGAVLWEAFVGRPAFDGEDAEAIAEAISAGSAPPLVDEVDTSQGLSYVLSRALRIDPEERFGDGGELHDAMLVLDRRLRRGLTARRRFALALPDSGGQGGPLAQAFRRLVGDNYRQRAADLTLLLSAEG